MNERKEKDAGASNYCDWSLIVMGFIWVFVPIVFTFNSSCTYGLMFLSCIIIYLGTVSVQTSAKKKSPIRFGSLKSTYHMCLEFRRKPAPKGKSEFIYAQFGNSQSCSKSGHHPTAGQLDPTVDTVLTMCSVNR